MKSVLFVVPALLLVLAGCITIDMGGGSSQAPKIVKFEVNPISITSGGAAVLSWEVSNASSVSIDPGIGNTSTHGSEKVSPAATTTYTITASNKAGSTESTALLTVGAAVTPPTPPITPSGSVGLPVITSFSATPSSISAGSSTVLNWSVTNATGAKISGLGNVATSGSSSVYPTTTTTYVIEAYNSTGQSSASTVITVAGSTVPPYSGGGVPSIIAFSASPSIIEAGGSTILNWNVINATSVNITGLGPVASSGSMMVTPSSTIMLTLTASNALGTTYATTNITVGSGSSPSPAGAIPHISAFYADPPSISAGASTTLTWGTYYATSVYIDNGVGYVSTNGAAAISPHTTTTYTITAYNSAGSTIATTQVVVAPVAMPVPYAWPAINDFHNSGSVVGSGGVLEAKLYWSVSNADTIVIDHGVGAVGASGSYKVYPVTSTTYTIMASNGGNTVAQTTTVVVP
ncbi:MAG: hypothetical protein ACYDHZ_06770 [Dehalococcoidia bacterium]